MKSRFDEISANFCFRWLLLVQIPINGIPVSTGSSEKTVTTTAVSNTSTCQQRAESDPRARG